ncbi:hypothetical protein MauCBS54593_000093 [Microsporum audouinii]
MSRPTNEVTIQNSALLTAYEIIATKGAYIHHTVKMFIVQILLDIAVWLLGFTSALVPEEAAHEGHPPTERAEMSDAPNFEHPLPYEGAEEDLEPDTPENMTWIMDYPSHPPRYFSSSTSSQSSSSQESYLEIISSLEALWDDWDPQPEEIDYPDRPTTPGILETTLANDTGSLFSRSDTDAESGQPMSPRPATLDSEYYIFNPTGDLEMSDTEL